MESLFTAASRSGPICRSQTSPASKATKSAPARDPARGRGQSDPDEPVYALRVRLLVDAQFRALAIAAAEGQKIYTLNANNRAIHGPVLQSLLIDQDVKWEISDALAAGKVVTVHEKDINVNGWVGSGYTILDDATGAGADSRYFDAAATVVLGF